jgi:hypothetical protein
LRAGFAVGLDEGLGGEGAFVEEPFDADFGAALFSGAGVVREPAAPMADDDPASARPVFAGDPAGRDDPFSDVGASDCGPSPDPEVEGRGGESALSTGVAP